MLSKSIQPLNVTGEAEDSTQLYTGKPDIRRCPPQGEVQNSKKIHAPILLCVDPRGGCLPTPYPGTAELRLVRASGNACLNCACPDWRELFPLLRIRKSGSNGEDLFARRIQDFP